MPIVKPTLNLATIQVTALAPKQAPMQTVPHALLPAADETHIREINVACCRSSSATAENKLDFPLTALSTNWISPLCFVLQKEHSAGRAHPWSFEGYSGVRLTGR